ncbi:farnesyl diphosphate synthase [Nitratireductor rhodophyticola]|uniref:Polyprenyl synthetase family protein n=1 Tax=Nitratireductor rhodophyticola TaxID=2854036 RepID=A0ABS7R576_9HYPH|nr:farnesyl diphosphate synthase [Nitratireductor rhodophyticola]MBY8916084.1 polyprenyl synthetase family protein [Nitratireductor rhodophyticola]MBY8921447.1 polyprenyl synthetase family protein [Nitratireductor rhodophyticola]MEC9243902.1 farnesyl diphosphate synthase [Pseudomonadota bacterium]WPZ16055.1 farnesyl diphosphate synthase [Nitratireductor rhodophyticola]
MILPFEVKLAAGASLVENTLRDLLDARPLEGELYRPERLLKAMRHGVLNGGKRLRPFLVLETAALFDASDDTAALRVAAALECVHCYSLVHDDLPAMDDDDLRRGQPTVHRAFDEAAAILAGDSLLTYAFDIVSAPETPLPAEARLALVNRLARASGIGGMAGGQALDLAAEGSRLSEEEILRLQAMKTGALIRFACEAGGVVGGAQPADIERLGEFGAAIGLAFQLADDLLDLTSSSETMGKATGKDAAAGKATLAGLHGVDWTRRQLNGLVAQAEDILEPFGERAETLRQAARFVADRQN